MQVEPHTLARRIDPATSHEAAERAADALSGQHADIAEVLRVFGRPMASEEIEDVLGYPVWRRMNELAKRGVIARTSETHRNRSGRNAYRYVMKEA